MDPAGQQVTDAETAGVIARPPFLFLAALLLGLVWDRLLPFAVPGSGERPGPLDHRRLADPDRLGAHSRGYSQLLTGRDAGTGNKPTRALVTTGIHGWTRNPIYLGMFLIYGGIGLAAQSPWI